MKVLYIVMPCYNEESVLMETASRVRTKLHSLIAEKLIHKKSKLLFVDDGSIDNTWSLIEELSRKDSIFGGVKLSRNRGHQNALLAGLFVAEQKSDIVISMDADLQDDINAIDEMLVKNSDGAEIVYGVRSARESDTAFKKYSALTFYKLMSKLGVDSVYNHADYRLMSKRAVQELMNFKETNLFLRGIVPLVGFQAASVEYERLERFAGESKYPLRKMLSFAIDGITSFSVKPLRIVTTVGLFISAASCIIMLYSLAVKLLGYAVSGWTFTVLSVWFIGGCQMLSIGIVGEYIGKIYNETKERPRYIIEKTLL